MDQEFILALKEIEKEKGISREVIFDALEKALIKSYEKNFDEKANVAVNINRENGKISVNAIKKVVEDIEDPVLEINIKEAHKINPKCEVGDEISIEVTPMNFGRIAAQTARNIVIQKIKDAERDVIYNEFVDREKEIITGTIQRVDRGIVYIDLGKIEGIIPVQEQVKGEVYNISDRLKLYISDVKNTTKGAQIVLSRANPGLVIRLMELEVPEINQGTVEIYSVAREAGSRTKISVFTKEKDIDPVGACVGFKGSRIKNIVDELKGEKIDIIIWDKDYKVFLANSLSPSEVIKVFAKEKERTARIIVPDDQLSLAIGKEGQNARLAAKLTGWKIDIKGEKQYREAVKNGDIEIMFDGEKEFLEGKEDSNLSEDFLENTDSNLQEEVDEIE